MSGTSLTYFITGVNRGIGNELARQLADSGHHVIGTVRDASGSYEISSHVELVSLDLADIKTFQLPGPIDVLINNAAINDILDADRNSPAVGALTPEHLQHLFNINTIGPLLLTQALLGNLRRCPTRRVIFMSSSLGSIALNAKGRRYAYRMSKAALNMTARTLAADLASEGFTVVAMDPGWVRTDMGGDQAPLSAKESATDILRTIESLTAKDNGAFLNRMGEPMPW